MKRIPQLLTALLLLSLLPSLMALAAPVATADTPATGPATPAANAKDIENTGIDLVLGGKFDEGLADLKQAYRLNSGDTNLGATLKTMQNYQAFRAAGDAERASEYQATAARIQRCMLAQKLLPELASEGIQKALHEKAADVQTAYNKIALAEVFEDAAPEQAVTMRETALKGIADAQAALTATVATAKLDKGQFSATADLGSKLKTGVVNDLPAIDTCALAIQLGATFVGRSFSGDKKQLLSMLKAAIAHKGTVMIDVISPCVTFNDHEGSTKSYKFMQDNDEPINEVDFVASFDEIEVDYGSGEIYEVEMHDGSNMRLHKLHEDYDPTDKANAVRTLMEAHDNDEILTGVFYIDTQKPTFIDLLNLVDEPLGQLPESQTRPPKSALEGLMASLQ